MKKSFSRRSFLKTNVQADLALVAGTAFSSGIIKSIVSESNGKKQKVTHSLWSVKKELYVPSPEPRVGVTLSMCYIGSGLKREEIRAIIQSSDWVEKPRKRISANNGRTWSEWEIIDEKSKIQGNCTMEGGETQGGTGPYDPASLQLSNFSLLENRETNEIEIYLTRLGESGGGADIWTADAYKYTLSLL